MPSSEIYTSLFVGSGRCVQGTVRTASHRGIGVCYCRHKMMHVGRKCGASLELSLIHISEPTRLGMISYAVFRDLHLSIRRERQMCTRDSPHRQPSRDRRVLLPAQDDARGT